MSRNRSLFVSSSGTRNGATLILLQIIEYFHDYANLEIDVLLKDPVDPNIHIQFSRCSNVFFLSDLDILCKNKYSFIYSNTICNGDVLAKLRKIQSPVFTHLHELEYAISSTDSDSVKHTLDFTDFFIACSVGVSRFLNEVYKVPNFKIKMVHGFVQPIENEMILTSKFSEFNICCISNMDYRKGIDFFLLNISKFPKVVDRKSIYWKWIGDKKGFYEDLLPKEVSNVIFMDKRDNPWNEIKSVDLFFNFSREDPFPLTFLEALSRKIPVLGFKNSGGIDELAQMGCGYNCDMNLDSVNFFLHKFIKNNPKSEFNCPTVAKRQCKEIDNFIKQKLKLFWVRKISKTFTDYKTRKIIQQLPSFEYPKDHWNKYTEYKFVSQYETDVAGNGNIKFSIITPIYNPKISFLIEAASSIIGQTYSNWEWIVVDDGSADTDGKKYVEELASNDSRIKIFCLEKNSGISIATNKGCERASGGWYVFFDQDDLLHKQALFFLAEKIASDSNLQIIYTDEDKVDENGKHFDPYFKPGWNPALLQSQNYFCHLVAISKDHLQNVGSFNSKFDGAQDWDFCLRATFGFPTKVIGHIPKVLYHWRAHSGSCALSFSEKGKLISDVSKNLLHEHLLRNKIDAEIFQLRCGHWNVENNLPKQFPKVSVFFYGEQPRGKYHPSIESNIEKMLCKGGVNYFLPEEWSILTQKSEFNTYNKFCLDSFESEIVVFINPLVEPMHPAWLDSLVSHCLQGNVGFCGPRLVHPATSRVISAGMVMERGGRIKPIYENSQLDDLGDKCRAILQQNFIFLHPCCLVVRKALIPDKFRLLGEDDLLLLMHDLSKKGFMSLFVPSSNVYLHSNKGSGFFWSQPYEINEISETLDSDISFNENLMMSWGQPQQIKIE